jgi:hypothetical protein
MNLSWGILFLDTNHQHISAHNFSFYMIKQRGSVSSLLWNYKYFYYVLRELEIILEQNYKLKLTFSEKIRWSYP